MAPDARSKDLLYVVNVWDATVYSYPQGKLEGKIGSLYEGGGACADQAGNVYIVNQGGGKIYKYAHGRKQLLETLQATGEDPEGCAVDPTTGNLAVATLGDYSYGGNVAIYPDGSGSPTNYTAPNIGYYFYCGYDEAGNLFVDGLSKEATGNFVLAELPKGGSSLEYVTLDQYLGWPGGVQWDKKYLLVGDQNTTSIYRFRISGNTGKEVGAVELGGGDVNAVKQFYANAGKLVVPSFCNFYCSGIVLYYEYPAGGSPTKSIIKDIEYPEGLVVSRAAR